MNSLDVIRKYRSLKEDILYPFDEEIEKKFNYEGTINKIRNCREKLAHLRLAVDNLNKTDFQENKNALALTIQSMINVFHAGIDDLEPSLNQGKIIPHEIFNVIIRELSYALKTGYHPIFILYKRKTTATRLFTA